MGMKIFSIFTICLCLSCASQAVKGHGSEDESAVIKSTSDSSWTPVAEIDSVTGLSSGNFQKEKSSIVPDASMLKFEIYFGGSACDDISYSFEAHADSLHIVQKNGTCYRHGQLYGVKGVIKNLKPGKYVFGVIRRFSETWANSVYQKDVVVP